MRNRRQIIKRIEDTEQKIKSLKQEITELERENLLLSDKSQWFIEKEEEFSISKRPKKTEMRLVGRVYWNEGFVDEDNGEVITIERNMIVRVNNNWV